MNRYIDKDYAIAQVEDCMDNCKTKEEHRAIEKVLTVLKALPAAETCAYDRLEHICLACNHITTDDEIKRSRLDTKAIRRVMRKNIIAKTCEKLVEKVKFAERREELLGTTVIQGRLDIWVRKEDTDDLCN